MCTEASTIIMMRSEQVLGWTNAVLRGKLILLLPVQFVQMAPHLEEALHHSIAPFNIYGRPWEWFSWIGATGTSKGSSTSASNRCMEIFLKSPRPVGHQRICSNENSDVFWMLFGACLGHQHVCVLQHMLSNANFPAKDSNSDYLFEDWLHTSTALMRMIRIRKPYETLWLKLS